MKTILDDKPQIITIKEVFERLVALEAKYDLKISDDRKTSKYFKRFALFLLFFELVNFVLNVVLIRYFFHL